VFSGSFLYVNRIGFPVQASDQPNLYPTAPFESDGMFGDWEDRLTAIEETNQQGTRTSHKRLKMVGLEAR
jgi:hypothetical protein